jgi:hypothetical protein
MKKIFCIFWKCQGGVTKKNDSNDELMYIYIENCGFF